MNISLCNTTLEQLPNKHWSNTFGALIAIVSILAVFENGSIFLLFYKHPSLRTISNKILASIVTADLLTGLTVGPLYSGQLLIEKLNGNCMVHKVRRVLGIIFMGASMTSIVFLTIDRSHHLIRLRNYSMSNITLYVCLFMCWFLPIIASAVGLIDEGIHSLSVSVVGVLIITIIITCYIIVIIALKRHRRAMLNKKNPTFMKNERQAVKTVIVIITCYVAMLLPMFIEKGLYLKNVLKEYRPKVHMFTVLLFIANSIANPIIYCSRIPRIKKRMLQLFVKKSKKLKNSSSQSTPETSTNVSRDLINNHYTPDNLRKLNKALIDSKV